MKCKYCGEQVDNDSRFCKYCGGSLALTEVEPPQRALETCRIGWETVWGGERTMQIIFCAYAAGPRGDYVAASSFPIKYSLTPIRNTLLIPAQSSQAREAYRGVVYALERAGWQKSADGLYWFSALFVRAVAGAA